MGGGEVKFVDVKWFTGKDTIGILLIDNGFGHKAYIGTAGGLNEEVDKMCIFQNGSRFSDRYAERLWPDVKDWADRR